MKMRLEPSLTCADTTTADGASQTSPLVKRIWQGMSPLSHRGWGWTLVHQSTVVFVDVQVVLRLEEQLVVVCGVGAETLVHI